MEAWHLIRPWVMLGDSREIKGACNYGNLSSFSYSEARGPEETAIDVYCLHFLYGTTGSLS